MRRYQRGNHLRVMVTLTCADQTHDRGLIARRVGRFLRRCHQVWGHQPYVVVYERHKSGAWHAHVAVPGYRRHAVVKGLWPYGFVSLTRPRRPAAYLSKYLGKSFEALGGGHRYEVAQGYSPEVVRAVARGEAGAWRAAVELMGGELPSYEWRSDSVADWRAPPAGFLSWDETR